MKHNATHQQIVSALLSDEAPFQVEQLAQNCCCSVKTARRHLKELSGGYLSHFDVVLAGDNTSGYLLEGKGLAGLKEEVGQRQGSVSWRNRRERQLLILLELATSPNYFAKLYTLGSCVQVAESTVLKDIRSLNQAHPNLQIQSSPGIGTQICCSKETLLNGLLKLCYGLFDPGNFLRLAQLGSSMPLFKMACTSNCFFQFIEKQGFPLKKISTRVSRVEEANTLALSDLSYVNLYLFLALRGMIWPTSKTAAAGAGPALAESAADVQDFIIGLEAATLEKLCPQFLAAERWSGLEDSLRRILSTQLPVTWSAFWADIQPQLALLEYRRHRGHRGDRGAIFYPYWDSFLGRCLRRSYPPELVSGLEALRTQGENADWLELESLLEMLQPYLQESDSRIGVVLVCVTGTGTTLILQKMLERFCPDIRIDHTYSLREYLDLGHHNQIIISTVKSHSFPEETIYIEPFFERNDWAEIQEQVMERG